MNGGLDMKPLNTLSIAHDFIRKYVEKGDICIDATAGRGRDTVLLCSLVGDEGTVYSFDIQDSAIESTKKLVSENGYDNIARIIQDSHANLGKYVEPASVSCIVFNFGRLPGGDPKIFTVAPSSIAALNAGLEALKPGGVMCLCIYYGGENGYGERDALLDYLRGLDDKRYTVILSDFCNRRGEPPLAAFVYNRA